MRNLVHHNPKKVPTCFRADVARALAIWQALAFGPKGLGLLVVSGHPEVQRVRQRLLPLAATFASLPAATRSSCEDPASVWSYGWSHGRESLQGGAPDTLKGSYYANPLRPPSADLDRDCETKDGSDIREPSAQLRPNLWPRRSLPELEPSFRGGGELLAAVGQTLARRLDAMLAATGEGTEVPFRCSLLDAVSDRESPKGRLLHYFAPFEGEECGDFAQTSPGGPALAQVGDGPRQWCGWHLDHGSLTGLFSALFLDASGAQVPSPDPEAGLYVHTRAGAVVRVHIPSDSVAFQLGEAAQIASGGRLHATPHCVRGPRPELGRGVSRNTFALFLQPPEHAPLESPPGREAEVMVKSWRPGMTFGEFADVRLAEYYAPPAS